MGGAASRRTERPHHPAGYAARLPIRRNRTSVKVRATSETGSQADATSIQVQLSVQDPGDVARRTTGNARTSRRVVHMALDPVVCVSQRIETLRRGGVRG